MKAERLRMIGIAMAVGGEVGCLAIRTLALDHWIALLFFGLIPWAEAAAFLMLALMGTGILAVSASFRDVLAASFRHKDTSHRN